ncbi:DJ-1/PfpI family protein [Candidatus Micrarchaeota archaeon]|nr:DJ-1/PfpI family protein [Candidatus Micrarchaeota archaeon]
MAKILMLVAQQGFKDEELIIPKEMLEKEKHRITIASISRTKATSSGGRIIEPDIGAYEASPEFFDCFVIVGGPGSPTLAEDPAVRRLLADANKLNKKIAAICLGPMALAKAGVLKGKDATVFPDSKAISMLKANGACYFAKPLVIHNNIITADCPDSAGIFGDAIIKALKEKSE